MYTVTSKRSNEVNDIFIYRDEQHEYYEIVFPRSMEMNFKSVEEWLND